MKKGDIAVIGMAGRFPGAATVAEFWKNLIEGKDCVTWLTDDSLLEAGVAKSDIEKSNYVKAAYLLDGYDTFDAEFFTIPPVDAELMDPQIRLALQCAWNTLEDAGYASMKPKNVGVFAGMGGVTTNYLSSFINRCSNIEKITASKSHTGNDKDFVANFISYKLNLTGPSVAVQTACSTSLVAVHQACSALLNEECEMCLAGGVNIRVPHAVGYEYKRGYIFSKSGRIRSFDTDADGVVFGNGVGMVLLKSLSKAVRDGDHIYAVVKGTAVSNDGKDKISYTATTVDGQFRCIDRAIRNAAVDPDTLGFVESHGTGTYMGDPMEVSALARAFTEGRSRRKSAAEAARCALGAVKTSVGHLDVAAGITGFIKAALSLHHKRIPPTLHFQTPNPRINFSETPFFINTDVLEWKAEALPRRAGVNSVGVGGTNAFAVLEEYVSKARKAKAAPSPQEPMIVPLSARSEGSLRRYAAELARFLDTQDESLMLGDLAYTLQTGRESMACRCALVVTDMKDLRRELATFVDGGASPRIVLSDGQIIASEPPAEATVSAWIRNKDWDRLAAHWVEGHPISWTQLHGAQPPRRISLPGYSFDAKRFWMDSKFQIEPTSTEHALHPLLQSNVSDWESLRYRSVFNGTEFFLAQHRVQGRRILPGAACLEMARAALDAALPSIGGMGHLRLKCIEWILPIDVDGPTEVELELIESDGSDGQVGIAFQIRRPDHTGGLPNCRGLAEFIDACPVPSLDPQLLGDRSAPVWQAKDEIYKLFSGMGLGYGPAFQVIQSLHRDQDSLVASISSPSATSLGDEAYALHPAVLDGALQACTLLGLGAGNACQEPPLPFALESLILYRPCPTDITAWVRYAPGSRPGDAIARFDADLIDTTGAICAALRGFSFRHPDYNGAKDSLSGAQPAFPRLQAMIPVWSRLPTERDGQMRTAASDRLLAVHYSGAMIPDADPQRPALESLPLDPESSIETIAGQLKSRHFDELLWIAPAPHADGLPHTATTAAFRVLKALLSLGHGSSELKLTCLIHRCQSVIREDRVNPSHAGIVGLIGSLAKEFPRWQVRLLDIDFACPPSLKEILSMPGSREGHSFAWRGGEWFSPGMAGLETMPTVPAAFRHEGVYVLIGGAGGLGEALTRHLIETYQAKVIWIGRSPLSPSIEAKMQRLSQYGTMPIYLRADATDEESLRQAYRSISSVHPRIHGVVHAAIVLQDKSLNQMDEARFNNGFLAKADVAIGMQRVFGSSDLDFMLFFSSMQSFYKAPGQANYGAGCTFQDSFAHFLNQIASHPAKIVNWGFWGNVGVVSNEFYKQRMAEQGVGSIEVDEGMRFLEDFLGAPIPQAAAVKALDSRAFQGLSLTDTVSVPVASPMPRASIPEIETRDPALGVLSGGLTSTVMDDHAIRLLASTLATLGHGDHLIEETLLSSCVPYLRPWMESSLRALRDHGTLDSDGRFTARIEPVEALWREWEERRGAWMQDEVIHAHVELLEACLRALPEILTGSKPATQVIFPDSSLRQVQGVYSDNPVSDYYNDLVVDALVAHMKHALGADPERKFRILEVGAGTGGTTARLIPKLGKLADALVEYRYSDLSKAFLIHAQERFGKDLPVLATTLFDVGKPIRSQSIPAGTYDFVLATNVLHATPDIRESLRNTKAALKSGGVLLLNEISTWSLYSHLTFGLLEGWWLYLDGSLRIAGSAALAPECWRRLLVEEGFSNIMTPAWEHRHLGQQVFIACSDGVVRQRDFDPSDVSTKAGTPDRKSSPSVATPPVPGHDDNLRPGCIRFLQRLVANTLRMDMNLIDPDAPLETYGLDSILILSFTDKLREHFSGITSTLFFEVQTLGGLADHFLHNHPDELKAAIRGETGAPQETSRREIPIGIPARISPERSLRARRLISASRSPASPVAASAQSSDIAIIGLGGRYPQSPDMDSFWRNLANGNSCISEIPRDRWHWEDFFDEEKGKPGKIYSKWGGFLTDIDKFDPLFFRISPKEAKRMDPQERLFLECAYHAMEDAGYTPANLGSNERIGVFAGVMNARYSPQPYYFSIANRVSYLFDFRGPSMAIDTACSSSLTAIHLAVESIVNGTCDCAIAGGVNLIIDPVHYQELSDLTMLSSGDRVKSFGNLADGFIDAEGVGAVVLKPLHLAERDKDHIYAVIKGSAINAGGKTNGYTVPNPKAQTAVVATALERSGIPASELGYIEAHGTGTALGDPIEIAALSKAFRYEPGAKRMCRIGSVKSNIGHCESAAGIAGLTKVLLQMKHGQLAPSLHASEVNPEIDFEKSPFTLQRRLQDWDRIRIDRDGRSIELPRAAGISSFGAGGANAHIIVQEHIGPKIDFVADGRLLFPLSARTPDQLRRKVEEMSAFLRNAGKNASLASIAYTLQVGRESMSERMGTLAGSVEELAANLDSFLAGEDSSHRFVLGQVKANKDFVARFLSDTRSQAALEEDIDRQNLERLLELWVKGIDLPWPKLYPAGAPQRVSLPGYPFARERYWEIRARQAPSETKDRPLHPFVHRNTSSIRHLQFTSKFQGEDFLLAPQRNEGRRSILPSMFLEMARAALDLALTGSQGRWELRGVEWAGAPLPAGDREIHIALLPEAENAMAFEFFSEADGVESIHCQGLGSALTGDIPRRNDVPSKPGAGSGAGRWVHLALPGESPLPEGCLLHPQVLDAIFASTLVPGAMDGISPVRLAALRVHTALDGDMMAWIAPAREAHQDDVSRFDVDVCRLDGEICVQLMGLEFSVESLADKPDALDMPEHPPADRMVELPGLPPIRLETPRSQAPESSESAAPVVISLADLSTGPAESDASAGRSNEGVSLSDLGDGIYAITVDAPDEGNRLTTARISVVGDLLRTLTDRSVKALVIRGTADWFLQGGALGKDLPASLDFLRTLASVPYPTLACVEGNADGAGWLAAALCDFLILSDRGTYRWTTPEENAPIFPGLLEFHRARFGSSSAEDFLCLSKSFTGQQLRDFGFSCRILPQDQVRAAADMLATELAGKPEKSLRLLKQHLGREITGLVESFKPAPDSGDPTRREDLDAGIALDFPSGGFRLTESAPSVLQVEIPEDLDGKDCQTLLDGLQSLFAHLRGSTKHRAIVLTSAHPDFFPSPEEAFREEAWEKAIRTLSDCPVPVIAAARGSLRGFAWFLCQLCDGCVTASASTFQVDASVSESMAATLLSLTFGVLGKEILMSGREYSGSELAQRCPACTITESEHVLDIARERAKRWADRSAALALWRAFRLSWTESRPLRLVPIRPPESSEDLPAQAQPIALASQVIRATVHPEGIVLVEMVDRESKNLFSPRWIEGMIEVFAHLDSNPRYKVVILTGYDSYFATGGTRESLLDIQAGKARFTDQSTTDLPLRCEIPVIAAVQGHAVGGGLSLAQFCDFAIFAEEGRLVSPYMGYGFTPGAGATLATPAVLGYDLGRENLLNSQEFEGADLTRRRTSLTVFPRKQVLHEAIKLARALAGRDRHDLASLKRLLSARMRDALEETHRHEIAMHEQSFVGQTEARERIGRNFLTQVSAPFTDSDNAIVASLAPSTARSIPASATGVLNQAAVRSAIGDMLAKELHLDPKEIEADRQFVDLGLDSIVGVTWVRKINQRYGTSIETVRIYSYPTLEQFGDFVWEEVKRALPELPAPGPANGTGELAEQAVLDTAIPNQPRRIVPASRLLESIRSDRFSTRAKPQHGSAGAIAVVGMSGRFPKSRDLAAFWRNIAQGRDCIDEIPLARWDIRKYYQEGAAKAGKTNSKWMGMLEDHDKFDPLFFNISPKEAIAMDPQQRVFLEACWHAIEYAGYNPGHLAGSKCGVFAGCSTSDYHQQSPEQKLTALGFTGSNCAILAARIAYFLDLLGPCLSIETACSSSLVAIATACDSLVAGTSDLALAGGVNVMPGPEVHIKTAQSNMLSARGRCFAFDSRADGLVPGEGVGVLLLKRLSDAERDEDRIYGVIEAWGINQDGKTNGITAPKAESQRTLIQETYERFGIDASTIQLVEAHGTGTKLGDPIEVAALKDAFRKFTDKRDFCALGSVKSNIGHTFTAAGVAGVLKCLWALKEGKLPPTINFDRLNEHITLEGSPFFVNTRLREWKAQGGSPRRAAVSSFGFGGTNCHLVVSEHRPKIAPLATGSGSTGSAPHMFPLSARTKEQLDQLARDFVAFLDDGETSCELADIAYTLQAGRKPMEFRLGVLASSRKELRSRLLSYIEGTADTEAIRFGRSAAKEDGIQVIQDDAEFKETITLKWIRSGKLHKLLELWVHGVELDWSLLHGAGMPKRTFAPLYPFARQRYWIEAGESADLAGAAGSPAIHPLLHENISDLRQFAFRSEFTGKEPIWDPARFGGPADTEPSGIPASAQLEMLVAALERIAAEPGASRPLGLRNIRWDRSKTLRPSAKIKVEVFDLGPDGLGIEITSLGEEMATPICQSFGRALGGIDQETRIDPAALMKRMKAWDKSRIDAECRRVGTGDGSAAWVKALHAGTGEMLISLRNPGQSQAWEDKLRIDPALLHQALRFLGVEPGIWGVTLVDPTSPSGIDSIDFVGRCGRDMLCWIRRADSGRDGFDLDLMDSEGKVAVRFQGIRFSVVQEGLPVPCAIGHATSGLSAPAQAEDLERELQASLAQVLYLEASDVDPDVLFTDLGMDSIIGVEWVDALNKRFGLRWSATVLYQHPTIKKLGEQLRGQLDLAAATPRNQAPAPEPAPAGIDEASDRSELIAGLAQQLAEALYLPVGDIDPDSIFTDLGMDSIIGVEWVSTINKKYGTSLSATALYQHPTLVRLAGFIREELGKGSVPRPAPSAPRENHVAVPASEPTRVSALNSFRRTYSSPILRSEVEATRKPQGIAVIGMAGQFPQAEDIEIFWRNIRDGRDCIGGIPENRWRNADFHQPGKPAHGKYYSPWMGAVDGVDLFDPLFFNISPTEAKSMDPQQRLFLQSCWHSIENAGYSADSLSESRCGVFVGASKGDYLHLSKAHELSSQGFTGGAISILAARASYFMNLLGPCVSIDTACSSALVAIASACDSLNARTSDLALAGGVFVMSSPEMHIMTSQAGMLSPDGRCKAFDQSADGFVPADGVGMLVLKRLDDAEKDGDNILGVIEGWGVNQDGKTNGITAPNAASQTRLIQDVYDRFGIDAEDIQLVEAHGTGTKLGDPIETDALKKAFGKYTRKKGYCAVGSVKSNIGHALTAAGVAGVIKVLLALQTKKLPPTIHVSAINSYIELDGSPFYINTSLKDWEVPLGRRRKAAVSSFGFSGTNAHLVISEYVARHEAEHHRQPTPGSRPIPLSAKTREQLVRKAEDLLRFLARTDRMTSVDDLAYTLQVGRDAMPHRIAIAAGDIEELAQALQAFTSGRNMPGILWEGRSGDPKPKSDPPETAFMEARSGRPDALLEHWIQGGELDWSHLHEGRRHRRIPLPGYPFAKQRLWIEKPYSLTDGSSGISSPRLHPLLHRNTSDLVRQSYATFLTGEEPFLKDHRLKLPGMEALKLLPGSVYLEMARAAFELALPDAAGTKAIALENVVWMNPCFVDGEMELAVALYADPDATEGDFGVTFEVSSRAKAGETIHCRGEALLADRDIPARVPPAALSARMRHGSIEHGEIYASFTGSGLIYGPSHRCLSSILMGDGEALARLDAGTDAHSVRLGCRMPPGLLDGALQSAIGLLWKDRESGEPKVPFSVSRLIAHASCQDASHVWVRRSKRGTDGDLELDIDVLDGDGQACVQVKGFTFRQIASERPFHRENTIRSSSRSAAKEEMFMTTDADFENLLEQVITKRLSVEEATELL